MLLILTTDCREYRNWVVRRGIKPFLYFGRDVDAEIAVGLIAPKGLNRGYILVVSAAITPRDTALRTV